MTVRFDSDPEGPLVKVVIDNDPDWNQLRDPFLPEPQPVHTLALLDTGASHCLIDKEIADRLRLVSNGPTAFVGASSPIMGDAQVQFAEIYVGLVRVSGLGDMLLQMRGMAHWSDRIGLLLGREFLDRFRFVYDGPARSFSLERTEPWP